MFADILVDREGSALFYISTSTSMLLDSRRLNVLMEYLLAQTNGATRMQDPAAEWWRVRLSGRVKRQN